MNPRPRQNVDVFQFEIRHVKERMSSFTHSYHTQASILLRGGRAFVDTARAVPCSEVDEAGLWRGKKPS
jgi:hypothetical protein